MCRVDEDADVGDRHAARNMAARVSLCSFDTGASVHGVECGTCFNGV